MRAIGLVMSVTLWFAFRNRALPLPVDLNALCLPVRNAASGGPASAIVHAVLGPLIPRYTNGDPMCFAAVETVRARIMSIDYTPKDRSQIRAQALITAASIDYATLYGQKMMPVDVAFGVMLVEEAFPETHVRELIQLLAVDQNIERTAPPLFAGR